VASDSTAPEHVLIFDTTLRDGEESPGATLQPAQRLHIAELLAAAGVDCIEAGFPAASPLRAASVAEIAGRVRGTRIAAVARCTYTDIEAAATALADAPAPRIHLVVATSDLNLSKKLRITREAALERITDSVRFARRFTDDIEFSAEDASRSDLDFVAAAFGAAIRAGAATVGFPDTVGYATPDDVTAAIAGIRAKTHGIENATLSIHMRNDLGLATANALAAVKAGARQARSTVSVNGPAIARSKRSSPRSTSGAMHCRTNPACGSNDCPNCRARLPRRRACRCKRTRLLSE